jgi:hypothetical protein
MNGGYSTISQSMNGSHTRYAPRLIVGGYTIEYSDKTKKDYDETIRDLLPIPPDMAHSNDPIDFKSLPYVTPEIFGELVRVHTLRNDDNGYRASITALIPHNIYTHGNTSKAHPDFINYILTLMYLGNDSLLKGFAREMTVFDRLGYVSRLIRMDGFKNSNVCSTFLTTYVKDAIIKEVSNIHEKKEDAYKSMSISSSNAAHFGISKILHFIRNTLTAANITYPRIASSQFSLYASQLASILSRPPPYSLNVPEDDRNYD